MTTSTTPLEIDVADCAGANHPLYPIRLRFAYCIDQPAAGDRAAFVDYACACGQRTGRHYGNEPTIRIYNDDAYGIPSALDFAEVAR